MAMRENESVSTSLIMLSELQNDAVIALDVLIDGDNEALILHRRGQEVRAWRNVCPHAGRRLEYAPGKFLRDQKHLICAVHGATFRLEDGQCIAGSCRGAYLRAVPVMVEQNGALTFG